MNKWSFKAQDGTRVSLLVDQRLNAQGQPAENGTLKVPDATGCRWRFSLSLVVFHKASDIVSTFFNKDGT